MSFQSSRSTGVTKTDRTRAPKEAWLMVALLFLFMLINFADKAVIGIAAVPIMQELQLGPRAGQTVFCASAERHKTVRSHLAAGGVSGTSQGQRFFPFGRNKKTGCVAPWISPPERTQWRLWRSKQSIFCLRL